MKRSLRLETRQGKSTDFYGFLGRYAMRLNPDWSGMLKEDFSFEQPQTGSERIRHALTLGAARRPRTTNVYHFLGLYQWKEEREQDGIAERSVHLISTHHNYQAGADVLLSGRLAGKWQAVTFDADAYEGTVQLAGGASCGTFPSDGMPISTAGCCPASLVNPCAIQAGWGCTIVSLKICASALATTLPALPTGPGSGTLLRPGTEHRFAMEI